MECLIHHEEHEGYEEAGGEKVFYMVFFMRFMPFMPFMVKPPSVNEGKPWNFRRWPEEENERHSFTGIGLNMNVTHLGGQNTVTGSCHLLQCKRVNILVDCGLAQGKD
jgi:hypothetical protein